MPSRPTRKSSRRARPSASRSLVGSSSSSRSTWLSRIAASAARASSPPESVAVACGSCAGSSPRAAQHARCPGLEVRAADREVVLERGRVGVVDRSDRLAVSASAALCIAASAAATPVRRARYCPSASSGRRSRSWGRNPTLALAGWRATAARLGLFETGDQAQQCRLTDTVWADDRDARPGADRSGDVVQHRAGTVAEADAAQVDAGRGHRSRVGSSPAVGDALSPRRAGRCAGQSMRTAPCGVEKNTATRPGSSSSIQSKRKSARSNGSSNQAAMVSGLPQISAASMPIGTSGLQLGW